MLAPTKANGTASKLREVLGMIEVLLGAVWVMCRLVGERRFGT